MADAPVVVASFGKPELAGMAASVLRSAGMEASADNRLLAEINDWALGPGGVEVCVLVPAADAERARAVLAETTTPEPRAVPAADDHRLRCLSCGAEMGEDEDTCPACGWTYATGDGPESA